MATAVGVISVIAAVGGFVQQRKASKEQRRQNRIQNKIAATTRSRATKRLIAQRRIATAQAQSAGFQLGVSGGTAVQGAVGGITSDIGSSIGAANQQFTGQQAIAASQNTLSGIQQTAGAFQALGNLAGIAGDPQNQAAFADFVGA